RSSVRRSPSPRRTPAPRRAAHGCARPPHARSHELRPAAGAAVRVRRRRAAPRRSRAGLRPGVPPAVDSWNPPGWGRGENARISPAVGRRRPAVGEYGRSLLEWEELPGYSRCDGATSLLVAPAFLHGTCLSSRCLAKPRGNTGRAGRRAGGLAGDPSIWVARSPLIGSGKRVRGDCGLLSATITNGKHVQ